ncbi:MAG: Hsp20/alpha crystallin family protein [Burkholderiaceae bacterium]|nr:Hsp20/alpha crystallin family protein [Burkholderiaceae bacterium]
MFGSLLSGFDAGVFDDFRRIERELDRFLFHGYPAPSGIRSMRPGTFPPMNVGVTPDRVDVYLFVAGIDPNAVELSLQQNVLSIAGRREAPSSQADEKAAYYRRERFAGEFRRAVTLPEDVDPERVDARYRDGVLQVTIQRRESARPRSITIQ